MADKQNLNAGFTGTSSEPPEGLTKAARSAANGVTREVYAVASGVRDHPHTASALLLSTGILAFGLGYLLGRSSNESLTSRYWR